MGSLSQEVCEQERVPQHSDAKKDHSPTGAYREMAGAGGVVETLGKASKEMRQKLGL